MVLELVGSRVIGPYYGVSLYVWASLIATAMVALALGYWIGGRIADRKAHPDYLYGSILLASLFTLLIPLIRAPVLQAVSREGSGTRLPAVRMHGGLPATARASPRDVPASEVARLVVACYHDVSFRIRSAGPRPPRHA